MTGSAGTELRRALDRCALIDRSDRARLLGTGPDLLDLLQRLSTGDVKELSPGDGRTTVLTTNKGRIVDLLFVHHLGQHGVLLVGGRGSGENVLQHLNRFTFREQTGLTLVDGDTVLFSIVGPGAREAFEKNAVPCPDAHAAVATEIDGNACWMLGHDGYSASGVSVFGQARCAAGLRGSLCRIVESAGGGEVGSDAAEAWRILSGLPESGRELTADHNPLEAGLEQAVSFDKGCYVGQEVVARLRNYDKVSRGLFGLELDPDPELPESGVPLLLEGRTVGKVTSATRVPGVSRSVALAYVKLREAAPGDRVRIGSAEGPEAPVVPLPFPR